MSTHPHAGAIPAAIHSSFLAACSIGGTRVALAPDFGSGAGEREFKAAANALHDKLRDVKAIGGRIEDIDGRLQDVEQKSARRHNGFGGPVSSDPFLGGGQSLGADFSTSQALSEFKSNGYRGAGRFECKAVITSAIGSTGGALGGMVAPDRAGVVPIARRPLTVRQLCQQGRTESNVITVMRQATRNNGATVVLEGQLKPESGLTFTEASFRCATLATHVTITRQALDDSAGLRALIDGELRGNLAEIEELQMLLGNGMGDNFLGLVPSAQLFNAPFRSPTQRRSIACSKPWRRPATVTTSPARSCSTRPMLSCCTA